MATHVLTAFHGVSASGTGPWSGLSWPSDSLNGSTGAVSMPSADAGGFGVSGTLVDTGAVGPSIVSVLVEFDWEVTNSAASGQVTLSDTITTVAPFVAGPGASASGHFSGSPGSVPDRATLFSWSFGFGGDHAEAGAYPFDQTITISNFTVTVVSSGDGPAPSLDTIQPTSGAATGGDTVTLRGHGFTADSVPTFDGLEASNVVVVSATTLTCSPPPHAIGSVDVVVEGCGTLTAGYRYTARMTDTNVIIAGSAPNLPPIPAQQPPVDPRTSKIDTAWLRWLNVLKQRVEAVVGADASQIVSGLFSVAQIPTLPWSKVDKAGSSLADLETRNAGDLVEGMLPVLRLPPLTGDVTSERGSDTLTIADDVIVDSMVNSAAAVAWSKISKVGSSLADLATRSASDLASGLLALARGGLGFDASGAVKGDLIVGTAAGTLALKNVGADGQVLTADAASAGGVKWADAASSAAGASAYRGTNQTLTHGTEAAISFSAVNFDTDSFWSSGAATRLTVPSSGLYTINAQIALGTGFAGTAHLRIYVNGSQVGGAAAVGADLSSGTERHTATWIGNLTAADYIELKVLLELAAGSGTFAVVGGSTATFLEALGGSASGGAGMTQLTGDVTAGPGSGSQAATLAASGVTAGTFGDATHVAQVTVDAKGRVTAASSVAITGGGGALVLLEQHTASASASLDFTTRNATGQSGATFQSDFDEYLIEAVNLIPATNGVQAQIRVSTDGGATFDSGSDYQWATSIQTPAGGTGFTAISSATGAAAVLPAGVNNVANTAVGGGIRLSFRAFDPLSSTAHKMFAGIGGFRNSGDSNYYRIDFAGWFVSATAVNALQFLYSSGNIASGTIRIYGVAK